MCNREIKSVGIADLDAVERNCGQFDGDYWIEWEHNGCLAVELHQAMTQKGWLGNGTKWRLTR
jgi:hypothetical protein